MDSSLKIFFTKIKEVQINDNHFQENKQGKYQIIWFVFLAKQQKNDIKTQTRRKIRINKVDKYKS